MRRWVGRCAVSAPTLLINNEREPPPPRILQRRDLTSPCALSTPPVTVLTAQVPTLSNPIQSALDMSNKMRAVVYDGPFKVSVREVEKPKILRPNDVIVKSE